MSGSVGCSSEGVKNMFGLDKAGDVVHIGQGVASTVSGGGEPLQFFNNGGTGKGEEQGGKGATLSQPCRLLEPDGLRIWH